LISFLRPGGGSRRFAEDCLALQHTLSHKIGMSSRNAATQPNDFVTRRRDPARRQLDAKASVPRPWIVLAASRLGTDFTLSTDDFGKEVFHR
jgi:hypothetical protein